jgi:hypothetical protein
MHSRRQPPPVVERDGADAMRAAIKRLARYERRAWSRRYPLRGDNQDESGVNQDEIAPGGGLTEGGRSPTDGSPPPAVGFSEPVWRS